MENNTDYYHFSSMVPKVKKSIKKYKKKYNSQFLNKIRQPDPEDKTSPPKFLQPIKIYRFYGDLVTIDNPLSCTDVDEGVSQLDLFMNFKTISNIHLNIGETFRIEFDDWLSESYSSIELYIDRLNSLGNQSAHELANLFMIYKDKFKIKEAQQMNLSLKQCFYKNLAFDKLVTKKEMCQYNKMISAVNDGMKVKENCFCWKMKKICIKKEPYSQYGQILNEIEFNRKVVNFFMNKEMEDLTNDDALDVMHLYSVHKSEYYSFFMGVVNHLVNNDYNYPARIKTCENYSFPCVENINTYTFVGANYEESHYVVTFCLEQKYIDLLNEMRMNKKQEDSNKLCVQEARIKSKYKKIVNMQSNSLKTLCLLYYGNSEENKTEENEELDKEDYWDKVDQSKVCKYRLIENKQES